LPTEGSTREINHGDKYSSKYCLEASAVTLDPLLAGKTVLFIVEGYT
jgi:hypothetical protein